MSNASSSYGFTGWACICLVISLVGFWPSYVQPAAEGTYVSPSATMPLHIVCTSIWLLLLVSQPVLIQRGCPKLHQRIGVFGVAVAIGVVATGIVVQIDVMPGYAAADDTLNAVVVPFIRFSLLLIFSICVGLAIYLRKSPDWHKRLMFLGAFALLQSPLDRMAANVIGLTDLRGIIALGGHIGLMIAFVVWDRRSNGSVHPASKWGTIGISAFVLLSPALIGTDWWTKIAETLGRHS